MKKKKSIKNNDREEKLRRLPDFLKNRQQGNKDTFGVKKD